MFRLEGQKALITGATGGIGRVVTQTLIASGALVVASSNSEDHLSALQIDIGPRIKTLMCDMSNVEETEGLFAKAEALVGDIDILICAAGITKDNLAVRMKNAEWDDVININLTSTFKINRAAIKSMMRHKYGRIINVSSVVAVTGNMGQANYTASKAGMIAMSKSLALEVASRNITVNCIAPGFIDTPMTQALSKEVIEGIIRRTPVGRMGTSEDVATAVLFLASKESGFITGHTLNVNGGMLMA